MFCRHRPDAGEVPVFTYVDLTGAHPGKNDSTMEGYNLYASGSGGVCADLWGAEADSYWCSNASAGGWAEVDQECAVEGRLQIPDGFKVNVTKIPALGGGGLAEGAIVHAWHSQVSHS